MKKVLGYLFVFFLILFLSSTPFIYCYFVLPIEIVNFSYSELLEDDSKNMTVMLKNDILNPVLFEIYSRDNGNPEKGILEDVIIFKEYTLNDKGGFDFVWDYEESDVEYQKMKTYCEKSLQNDIVDFDDHLENASLDWRNQFIQ